MGELGQQIIVVLVTALVTAALTSGGWMYRQHRAKKAERDALGRTADLRMLEAIQAEMPVQFLHDLQNMEAYDGFPAGVLAHFVDFQTMLRGKGLVFHDRDLNSKVKDAVARAGEFIDLVAAVCTRENGMLRTLPRGAHHSQKKRHAKEALEVWKSAQLVRQELLGLYDLAKVKLVI